MTIHVVGNAVGGGSPDAIIAMGVLGSSKTLALAGTARVQATGTMSAACTLTITGVTVGCEAFLAITPDTVDRVLTIAGNAITIPAADAVVGIVVRSIDGATLLIDPGATNGANGANGTTWWSGTGAPGTVAGAVTGDLYVNKTNGEVYQSTSGASTWADLGYSIQGKIGFTRQQSRWAVLGLTDAAFDPFAASMTLVSPATQQVYGTLTGFHSGDVISNIWVIVGTLGAGTPPTGIYGAVYDGSGTRLAVSANVNSSTIWTATAKAVAIPVSYTVTSETALYLCLLQNGTWGTTQLQVYGSSSLQSKTLNAWLSGTVANLSVKQITQATMPSPATFAADTTGLWVGWS